MRTLTTIAVFLLLLNGCAYRFTNLAVRPPAGIRSVAIEAVYDTSREVLPHEQLWEALQRAFTENGKLLVTSQAKADALLRVHLVNAYVSPTDTPDPGDGLERDYPPQLSGVRTLTKAGRWTTKEAIGYTVQVELWDLRKRQLLFQRAYTGGDTFASVLAPGQVQPSMQYLLYEESLNTKFRAIARTISAKVVEDVFF